MVIGVFQEEPYEFPPSQRAIVPGGPARPPLGGTRRAVHVLIAVLISQASGLGNALVQSNSTYLLGALGAEATQLTWVPTAFVMTTVTANLVLVRFRMQFGLRLYAMIGLIGFSLVVMSHLLVGGYGGAIFIHAIAGLATAPLTALCVYYMMSAMPAGRTPQGAVLALGLTQISPALARLIPTEILALDRWRGLYLIELGVALLCLGGVALFRLPPSNRVSAFEKLDVVTYALLAPGLALLCAVLGMGRVEWWTDREWLGWALAASILITGVGLYIEFLRERPLLDLRWLGSTGLLRFGIVIIVTRIALSEQNGVAVTMLATLGVDNDELQLFSLLMVLAGIAGVLTTAAIFTPGRIPGIGALSMGLVAVAAYIDSFATSLTRAPELYVTQMMIAFSTTMFIGPALLMGFGKVIERGGTPIASFLVLFTITQNIGSLVGSSLLSTYQIIREKAISVVLIDRVSAVDPLVSGRIAGAGASLQPIVGDPLLQSANGVASLQHAMTREANTLAYNDANMLVAILAALTTLYISGLMIVRWRRRQRDIEPPAHPSPRSEAA